MADGKHGVLGAPMHMQSKETHKCNQNRISRVRVNVLKTPAEASKTVDAPAGLMASQVGLPFVSRFLV